MNTTTFAGIAAGILLAAAHAAEAAVPRPDIIWARRSPTPITLDGVLNEPGWALAESKLVEYGVDNGIPGSGFKLESAAPGIIFPTDPTRATLKFLVHQNQLYMAATVPDSSVGGSAIFNRFDGFLMAIKDHADSLAHPKPPVEYFYSWWNERIADPHPPGLLPTFLGRYAQDSTGFRDSTDIANWDAVTVVNGLSNSDGTIDQGYTIEMRFNLTPVGYDVTKPTGDVIEFNVSIYDCDWFWPLALKFASGRTWWQSPWGNTAWFNEVRIYARPNVTTTSGALPPTGFDIAIPELSEAAPVINGTLTEPAWTSPRIYDFDIRWDDDALRETYPETGPYRAGQYQPTVQGGTALVLDPADCTVKTFFKGNTLYLGFDVRDLAVQFHPDVDRWDGFIVTLNDRIVRGPDNELKGYRFAFRVAQNGTADPEDDLPDFITNGHAQLALALNPGTIVDTTGANVDAGYTAELSIDLTSIGYPPGLGDGALYLGVNHLDGDSFLPVTDSYGTRTWWYREYPGQCCPVIAYLAPLSVVSSPEIVGGAVSGAAFARAIASPSSRPGIEYSIPNENRVFLEVFDVAGRLVESRPLGVQGPGTRRVDFSGEARGSGVYLYRIKLVDPSSGALREELHGKAIVVK
jgi:hypothetical protein